MQPPSGGCVLKHFLTPFRLCNLEQPPSGGCVLKPANEESRVEVVKQPPSGGCVLKHQIQNLRYMHVARSRLRAAVR